MSPTRHPWLPVAAQVTTIAAFALTVILGCNHLAVSVEHRLTQLEVAMQRVDNSLVELRELFLRKHLMEAPNGSEKTRPNI